MRLRPQVYQLLTLNYVEDDDAMFRFDYSQDFLKWALQPPASAAPRPALPCAPGSGCPRVWFPTRLPAAQGFHVDWHIGVRVKDSGKLVAFITGIPAKIRVLQQTRTMAEINFLCVHKKLRSKRLAPLLIKEVTRRVNLTDVWQASYTAGVVLPKPVAICRYWHRSLNPKKLIEVGFSRLPPNSTMSRTIKLYKLPERAATPGVRKMAESDIPQARTVRPPFSGRLLPAPPPFAPRRRPLSGQAPRRRATLTPLTPLSLPLSALSARWQRCCRAT